jgi:hypothetical protein
MGPSISHQSEIFAQVPHPQVHLLPLKLSLLFSQTKTAPKGG